MSVMNNLSALLSGMEPDQLVDHFYNSTLSFAQSVEDAAPTPFLMEQHYLGYVLIVLVAAAFWHIRVRKRIRSKHSANGGLDSISPIKMQSEVKIPPRPSPKPTQWYKELFFKLHNLEDHADVLPSARDELLAMFSRSISMTLKKPRKGIFRIDEYNEAKLDQFMAEEHESCLDEWQRYLKRREQGSGAELFGTVEAAKEWLVQQAPVKFVDGAWLAHLHKITTPFSQRTITKNAWQVLSEELGDGDLSKHHVYLYTQLLNSVGEHLPEAHSSEFIESSHWKGKENRSEWVAAAGQLLISLFPDEFLPEILGFNMHYELITMDTLRANHELKELSIDPYYFLIHIVIDNADSGHTAMAVQVVTRYLDMIREQEGEEAMQEAWKRVQIGYAMSQTVGESHAPTQESSAKSASSKDNLLPWSPSLDPLSTRVVNIFKAKASVSHQFHCQSRVRIGGQTLVDWLAPSTWSCTHERGFELLSALSHAKPWVIPGKSAKSLLIRELGWKGRMFGAFTQNETADLAAWIDALGEGNALMYWNFTQRLPVSSKDAVAKLRDPVVHHPVVMPQTAPSIETSEISALPITPRPLATPSQAQLPDIIALWFAHIGLLENTINTPSRTAGPLYANFIYLLRAQAGFEVERPIVAGMDEFRRLKCPSLVDIGCELFAAAGWQEGPEVQSLQDVFAVTARHGQSETSRQLMHNMLNWATRPSANLGLLVGLALAFLDLKDAVAESPSFLAPDSQSVLKGIVARERQTLESAALELHTFEESQHRQLMHGYHLGRQALEECCGQC